MALRKKTLVVVVAIAAGYGKIQYIRIQLSLEVLLQSYLQSVHVAASKKCNY
jgi:hypothetical protein